MKFSGPSEASRTNRDNAYLRLQVERGREEISFDKATAKAEEVRSPDLDGLVVALLKNGLCAFMHGYACILHDIGQAVRSACPPSSAASGNTRKAMPSDIGLIKPGMRAFVNILHAVIDAYFIINEVTLHRMTERLFDIYLHGMRQDDEGLWISDFGAQTQRVGVDDPESLSLVPMSSARTSESGSDFSGQEGITAPSHDKGSCQNLSYPTCPSPGL